VDLIASELGFRAFTSDDDRPAGSVDLNGALEGDVERKEEELLKHFDDVVVSVLIVIEQDDVEKATMLLALPFLDCRSG